jgi:subtilisin family serine protease
MSITEARRAVLRVNLHASADRDSYYYTDEGAPGCVGANCEASILVGWTPSQSSRCWASPLIGLIDTRINLEHEALKGQAIELLTGFGGGAKASSPDHGTAIAALLVGRADSNAPGLIPGARLLAADAFYRENGTVDRADVISLVAALEALADRGVRIINLSLSGPPNEVLKKAVEAVQAKGVVLVAAAGNNGAGAEPSYPAAYPGVIAVTAVDRQLNVYQRATRGPYVDLAAPGVGIRTADAKGDDTPKSGTSYAVPFVAAAMALMRESHQEADIRTLQARLEKSAKDLGAPGRDTTFGYGLIQMADLCSAPDGQPKPVIREMPSAALSQDPDAAKP